MPIRIKKYGQISDVHIPPSLKRRGYDLEMSDEAGRIYTEAGDACGRGSGKYLVLMVSVENFHWAFTTWTQPEVGDEATVAANPDEVGFIRNIAMLQTKYDLEHIESPELCYQYADELPRYSAEDDDEECSDEELDAWLAQEDGSFDDEEDSQ
jgi:hypothetical protein